MTRQPHTPAPWTLEPPSVIGHADVRFGVKGADDGCAIIVASVGKYEIADANARLIAAAPDLLAAVYAWCGSESDQDESEAMKMAVAAIAKAEGAGGLRHP